MNVTLQRMFDGCTRIDEYFLIVLGQKLLLLFLAYFVRLLAIRQA